MSRDQGNSRPPSERPTIVAPINLREQLAAVEARYTTLLKELADLFQRRQRLRRRGAPSVAASAPPLPPALRLLRGKNETAANPAQRRAEQKSTRAQWHVVAGGRAAG